MTALGVSAAAPLRESEGGLAVLFTNLTWDTAVIGRDLAFPDIRAWLDAVRAYERDVLSQRV